MPYDPRLVQPMREELSSIGVQELRNPAEVDTFMAQKTGTALVVVNSVCGCAAGMARPGVKLALQSEVRPERSATVFAGQDLDATQRARVLRPVPAEQPVDRAFQRRSVRAFRAAAPDRRP